jgi:L-fuconolactonase
VIIDAHHHAWDPQAMRHAWLADCPALNRPFGMAEFEQASTPEMVTASILTQVLANPEETEQLLALARAADGRIAGVVGWADLAGPRISDELARLRGLPGGDRLVAIRHPAQDEPDPDWLLRPAVQHGLRAVDAAGLGFDLLVRPAQLPAALRVTADLDSVRFVLDHGGGPDIAARSFEPWASLIRELARRPNVVCTMSGLVSAAGPDWKPELLVPYADHLLNCFGPQRLMFGSDWPVCTLDASYGEVVATARRLLSDRLARAELDAFFAGNAVSAYRLQVPAGLANGAGSGSSRRSRGPSRHSRPLAGAAAPCPVWPGAGPPALHPGGPSRCS